MAGGIAVVYLLRHGRTRLNEAGLLRGHADVPLDEVGLGEAEGLGQTLAPAPIGVVVSSPLMRALDTAAAVGRATGVTVEVDERFIDRDYGPWTARPIGEAEAAYGSIDAAPGVEPREVFAARVLAALADAADRARGDRAVVVVAHDAVNRMALARLVPGVGEADTIGQRTGCWNLLERTGKGWRAPIIDALPGDGHVP